MKSENDFNNRWISVSERLPEDFQRVIALGRSKGIQICTFRIESGVGEFITRGQTGAKITHWMPLPPLPGEEEND